jgi:hypothetical protein
MSHDSMRFDWLLEFFGPSTPIKRLVRAIRRCLTTLASDAARRFLDEWGSA